MHSLRRLPLPCAALACLLALAGCVPNAAYHRDTPPQPIASQSRLFVIEVDERGPVFANGQPEQLQRWLADETSTRPIVVFVHGWHHNAQPDDTNLRGFEAFLGLLEAAGTGGVDGVYVGWRGDVFDLPPLPEAVDFPTLWSRKAAARRVGRGGLREVLDQIRTQRRGRVLMVIGHSLGGDAVFQSLRDGIDTDVEHGIEYVLLNPAVSEQDFDGLDATLQQRLASPPGDEPLSMIEATFRPHRKVTVFQALGDRAVGVLYRLAFLGQTPIGFDETRRSHSAELCETPGQCVLGPNAFACVTGLDQGRFVLRARGDSKEECEAANRRVVWVVTGADSVSRNHNDILTGVQAAALADLIARRVNGDAPK